MRFSVDEDWFPMLYLVSHTAYSSSSRSQHRCDKEEILRLELTLDLVLLECHDAWLFILNVIDSRSYNQGAADHRCQRCHTGQLLDSRVENREVRSLFLRTPGNFSALVIEKVVQLEELDDLLSLICSRTVEEEGTTIVCLYI